MTDGALADVVVLELATGVAGPYCGKLFADLGAQVMKVEPAGGDPTRHELPRFGHESAFFNYLNGNKLGVRLDLTDARIDALAHEADIVIHCERGPAADELDDRLRVANPRATIISITPYGRSGQRSAWKASPLTEWATGGYHYFGGDPNREPIALPGYQAEFHAGMHATVGALAALWHMREGGAGQVVEVSHQEAVLSDHSWLVSSWTHLGKVQGRAGSLYAPCADGFIFLFHMVPYPNLFVLMERFDLLEDEALQNPLTWIERWPEVFAAFSEWSATRTKQEIYHACQELRIAASPVNTMADVADSEQLESREWFETLEAGGRPFRAPGFPYRLMGTPCQSRMPAPALGEHTAIVLGEDFVWPNSQHRALTPNPSPAAAGEGSSDLPLSTAVERQSPYPGGEGPLSGLRLIEVTGNWAGPVGGRHLADLGADVIKVELATKPATRALIYVGDDLWPEHYHRSAYFNKMNRNKRDICLDLATPGGRDVFLKLVAGADAVLENNAARVMTQLGIGYEALREVNHRLVMCSMSGFGSTGPERNYSAYGSNIETLSGLASLLGYGDGQFFGTGSFYADPITGTHGAIAILAALHARRRTGRGQWIDMALLEAVAPFFAQQFLEYTVTGEVPGPLGNDSKQHSPHGVYRAFGTDAWVAIAVQDNQEWSALSAVIGRQDWAGDPELRTPEGRRARRGEIDAAIGEWCASRDRVAAAEALQAAGVPAAPVMPNWEIISDNHLNERDFFVRQSQPRAGTFMFPGFPWRFSETPPRVRMPAPLFGQHNREVFREVACLPDEEIEALYAAGVTSDAPQYSLGPGL